MNISEEKIDELNSRITIKVKPEDYQPHLESSYKKVQKTASMAGFRPGKVPVGMIRKMYGRSILADELNKLLNDSLYKYLEDNKISFLGNPMPANDGKESGDWENPADFEFYYELGIAPRFEFSLPLNESFDYLKADVDEKMIDNYIDDIRRRHGKFTNPEISSEGNILYGEFEELNEASENMENGIRTTTTMALEFIKDQKEREKFIGLKKGDLLVFDPARAIDNPAELAAMLKIPKEKAENLKSSFRFTVQSVNNIEKAELNKELFDKIYGENNVNSEEEFRQKVKDGISAIFNPDSDRMLKNEMVNRILSKLKLSLPDDFLKRWLRTMNEKPVPAAEIEKDYPVYSKQLQWQLLTNKILSQHPEIKVEMNEMKAYSRELIRNQFAKYGVYELEDDKLETYSAQLLKDEKEIKKLSYEIVDAKVFQLLKNSVKLIEKILPYEEFTKLAKQ